MSRGTWVPPPPGWGRRAAEPLVGDHVAVSAPGGTDRWAVPRRRWHRPTWRDALHWLLVLVVVGGTFLVITGDTGTLALGAASMLVNVVASFQHADEGTPYAARFSRPPDPATQRTVHEHVARGEFPADGELRDLAVDYAAGWTRRLRRFLVLATSAAAAWCLVCAALTAWFDRLWPESASARQGGLTAVVAGTAVWLVCFVLPLASRWWRLRRMA